MILTKAKINETNKRSGWEDVKEAQ